MATETLETAAPNLRPQRHWVRISLRTLLIVVTLVAVGLGLLMRHVHEQREIVQREQAAVAELQKLGGGVIRALKPESVLSSLPVWLRTILLDEEYRPVESVTYGSDMEIVELGSKSTFAIEGLTSSNTQHPDAGLKYISQFKYVGFLYLENTHFKDSELEYLVKLTSLQHIELNNSSITDAGLEHIGKLTTLEGLELCNTRITDAGLEHIRKLTALQSLSLDNTQITDAGIEHLSNLTALRWLNLRKTRITEAGIAKLQAALPQCRIY